jgi:hypothetical protein
VCSDCKHESFMVRELGAVVAFRIVGRDEGSGVVTADECLVFNNRLAKADVVGNTLDDILVELLIKEIKSSLTILAPADQLADHRIVVHRDLTALLHTGVNTHVRVILGLTVLRQEADRWQELP